MQTRTRTISSIVGADRRIVEHDIFLGDQDGQIVEKGGLGATDANRPLASPCRGVPCSETFSATAEPLSACGEVETQRSLGVPEEATHVGDCTDALNKSSD